MTFLSPNGREGGAVRILIVDDHDLFRTGLASLLGCHSSIEVVAQASGGRMGVRLAAELQPDVVLMDLRMPDLDGTDATRQIVAQQPNMRVLVLTVASGNADVEAALEAGACGFVAKDTPVDEIATAIGAAAQGVAWLSPRAAELVLGRVRAQPTKQDDGAAPLEQLSSRELDVLRLIAHGMENAQIADVLSISPRTAKNHVSNILAKLGLPGRVQAAIYAVRHGLD